MKNEVYALKPPCCGVSRPSELDVDVREAETQKHLGSTKGMIYLEGGTFLMGTDEPTFPADGEGPVREVTLSPFWIEPYAVTNEQFAAFVEELSTRQKMV